MGMRSASLLLLEVEEHLSRRICLGGVRNRTPDVGIVAVRLSSQLGNFDSLHSLRSTLGIFVKSALIMTTDMFPGPSDFLQTVTPQPAFAMEQLFKIVCVSHR